MTGQISQAETAPGADSMARLKAQVVDTNVNENTFLATDYLNHFNEIVMLLEMVPDMPDILEEAKEWRPKSYAQHFLDSGLSDGEITIKAYENAPAEFRDPFDVTIERMNRVVIKGIERIEAAVDNSQPEALEEAARTVTNLLQRLVDIASAIIHGGAPQLEQDEIDQLLTD